MQERQGIIQRLGLLFLLIWVEVMAIQLLRLPTNESFVRHIG